MKKKFLWFILISCLCALFFVLTACNGTQPTTPDTDEPIDQATCEHDWVKNAVIATATCASYERTEYVCTICEATKTETGDTLTACTYVNHVCSVCGKRQAGEQTFDTGDVKAYLYVATSSIEGGKIYTLVVDGKGETASYSNDNQPWKDYISSIRQIEVINGVTKIGNNFLPSATMLNSITLPSSVKEIGSGAFSGADVLIAVSGGSGVEKIGENAFSDCDEVQALSFPRASSVGYGAFSGCEKLRSLAIGTTYTVGKETENTFFGSMFGEGDGYQSVTQNGTTYTFAVPRVLISLEIGGDGVIPSYSLKGCTSIQTVTVSGGITAIGEESFANMSSLSLITFTNETLVSIGNYAFTACSKLGEKETSDDGVVTINSIVIPSSIVEIGEGAFSNCGSMTNVVINGSLITAIPKLCFERCSVLTSVVIPESVNYIGVEAFRNSGIVEIKIGKLVSTVGQDAFKDCSKLTTVYIDNEDVYCGSADNTGLFDCQEVWVHADAVKDTAKADGTSKIKTYYAYKGYDTETGYHLWQKK